MSLRKKLVFSIIQYAKTFQWIAIQSSVFHDAWVTKASANAYSEVLQEKYDDDKAGVVRY